MASNLNTTLALSTAMLLAGRANKRASKMMESQVRLRAARESFELCTIELRLAMGETK